MGTNRIINWFRFFHSSIVSKSVMYSCSINYLSTIVLAYLETVSLYYFYLFRIKELGERYFIPPLAIVDLVACFVSSPFYIMDNTFYFNHPSDIVCKILAFLKAFMAGFSGHILLVICIQRYLLVCRPFGPKMTLFWKKVWFATAGFISLFHSAPLLAISGNKTMDDIFLNHTIQTTLCKYYAVDNSPNITAYFGLLALISLVNITLTAALLIPLVRRIQVSFSGRMSKNKSSNTESNFQSTETCSVDFDTRKS
ncbi:Hypothetical predicted protein, partial [Mytilus galloprovincialis]